MIVTSLFTRHIHTEITINASPDLVWRVLCDFSSYEKWNRFILKASGSAVTGATLDIVLRLPGKPAQPYQVKLLEVSEPRILRWLGHFKVPFLCDGNHVFELIEMDGPSTKLIHSEHFSGLLVPIIWFDFKKRFLQAFNDLNIGLKSYVEGK